MINNLPGYPDVEVEIIIRADGHRLNHIAVRTRRGPGPTYRDDTVRAVTGALAEASDNALAFIQRAYPKPAGDL